MSKYFVYAVSESKGGRFFDTEKEAIEDATSGISGDNTHGARYIFKAVKVVKTKESPVVVEAVD